jgi:hypothetical protein
VLAEAYAEMADAAAEPLIELLREREPAEADAILARLRYRQGRFSEAAGAWVAAFERYRDDPWPDPNLMRRTLVEVGLHLALSPDLTRRLYDTLASPFVLHLIDSDRLRVRMELGAQLDPALCVETFAPYEPDVPWNASLVERAACYRRMNHPLAAKAERDLAEYEEQEGRRLSAGLLPGKD